MWNRARCTASHNAFDSNEVNRCQFLPAYFSFLWCFYFYLLRLSRGKQCAHKNNATDKKHSASAVNSAEKHARLNSLHSNNLHAFKRYALRNNAECYTYDAT